MWPAKEARHQYWSTGCSNVYENLKKEEKIGNNQEKEPRDYTDQETLVWRLGSKVCEVIRLEEGWHMEGGRDCRGRIFEFMRRYE